MSMFSYNKIVQISYVHFNSLPKTGKPKPSEWTVLSTITKHNLDNNNLEVVALGTGSKCIGISKMSSTGDILNDSHGEVICRRAFNRYLLEEIKKSVSNSSEIFTFDKFAGICTLKSNFEFHFFTTQVPCGDASIFPKSADENFGNCLNNELIEQNLTEKRNDLNFLSSKRIKLDVNITGAKCLSQMNIQDLKSRLKYSNALGEVRTKPGRGSPTLSVSCSDKFAKWCHLGLQGSLLSLLVKEPIFIKTLIVACASNSFDKNALQRALYDRFSADFSQKFPSKIKKVEIVQLESNFEFSKAENKQPSSCSIVWSKISYKALEVAVEGKRQGVTKNKLKSKSARMQICKIEFFRNFGKFLENPNFKTSKSLVSNQTYFATKMNAINYQEKWRILKEDGFKNWTQNKRDFEEFILD